MILSRCSQVALHEANSKLQSGGPKAGMDSSQERKQLDEQRRQIEQHKQQIDEKVKHIEAKERALQNMDQELKKQKSKLDQYEQQLQKVCHSHSKVSFKLTRISFSRTLLKQEKDLYFLITYCSYLTSSNSFCYLLYACIHYRVALRPTKESWNYKGHSILQIKNSIKREKKLNEVLKKPRDYYSWYRCRKKSKTRRKSKYGISKS
jgi:exonuclease VII large subunit